VSETTLFNAGIKALQAGRAVEARWEFRASLDAGEDSVKVWLGFALACVMQGDLAAAETGIDEVLSREGKNLRALIVKGDLLAGRNDEQNAAAHYTLALRVAATLPSVPPAIAKDLSRIQEHIQQLNQLFQQHLLEQLASVGYQRASAPSRFNEALDLMMGVKAREEESERYPQMPHVFYMPQIPYRTFYPNEHLPWMESLEDATDVIQQELQTLLAQNAKRFTPYVHSGVDRTLSDDGDLLDSESWTSAYLWQDGEPDTDVMACCPETVKLMESLPLTKIKGLAPSVLFSKLNAGATIAPHTGMLNARLICHLPLIVPPECGLRVGHDERKVRRGEGWAFDDSINHEAWNRSDQERIILLFDVWRPELDEEERQLITTLLESVRNYRSAT
jgi:aspartyl/asparaginyl beta-hydroxylase (cupin superfamily)